ncbi:nitroreductase [Nocardioides sp. Root190]|uniref:nitroreductase family protein n=1 Tax=Nocardioides sp. Root190 TaxID=1736488 RepID=UPI0007018F3B|nr:nitroreductase family protein [Nocardioides sp. Root190]KRB76334.1 nitroreductase [Nocardioides sp. Root190]
MNPVDIAEPLRSRWSPSVFDAHHELGDEDITRLLEAAQWAPSSGNRQPWRYVVAPRGSAAHQVLVPHLSRGNSGWVPRASVVFLSVVVPGADGNELGDLLIPVHDVGQASAHLTLQARAMGLHAHQFGGFDHDAVAAGLGIPATARVIAGIAVGVRGDPAEVSERDAEREHRVRSRRPLEESVYGERWDEPWTGVVASGPTTAEDPAGPTG